MIIEAETYEFLEHHGVKGMHWGVRNEKPPLSKEQRHSRNKKIAIGVGVGAVVVGATATALILKHNYNVKLSEYNKGAQNYKKAASFINSRNDIKIDQIRQAAKAGNITDRQSYRLRKLATRQTTSALFREVSKVPKHPGGQLRVPGY